MATTKPLIGVDATAGTLNTLAQQYLGKTELVESDMSNIIDFGSEYEALPEQQRRALTSDFVSLITDQLFISNKFKGTSLDLVRTKADDFTAASRGIIQVSFAEIPEAVDDSEAYDPEPNSSTADKIFKAKPVKVKSYYFAQYNQWRHEITIYEQLFQGMFMNVDKFNSFIGMLWNELRNAVEMSIDNLSRATLASLIALYVSKGNTNTKVNLLKRYNDTFGTTLEKEKALTTPEFLRFAANEILTTTKYMEEYTGMYNIGGRKHQTRLEDMQIAMLNTFATNSRTYLHSDTYHKELLELPGAARVNTWQAWKTEADGVIDLEAASSIKGKYEYEGEEMLVDQSGILAVAFDKNAAGIYNLAVQETSQYDPVGLRTNYWVHVAAQTMISKFANTMVFYIA